MMTFCRLLFILLFVIMGSPSLSIEYKATSVNAARSSNSLFKKFWKVYIGFDGVMTRAMMSLMRVGY